MQYTSGLSCNDIGKKFGVSNGCIRVNLIENGVKLRPSGNSENKRSMLSNQEILVKYKSGVTIEEIAELAGVKEQAIYKRLKRNGVKFPRTIKRNYKLDEEFFNQWSFEKAYILGIIITDGCMSKDRNTFSISQKEKSILIEIAKCFGMPADGVKTTKHNETEYYHLTVSSVNMCRSLWFYGITPNKSKTVIFPRIPKRYIQAFLRGVIDGDGSIEKSCYRVVVYTASEDFAKGLQQSFTELELNTRVIVDKRGLFRVTVSNKESVYKLRDIIYKHKGKLYLERKYQTFYAPRKKNNL